MFVILVGWGQVRQDPFGGCFNIPQKIKIKVAMKGWTFNANMDKFVKRKICFC